MNKRKDFLAYAICLFLFLPFSNTLHSQSFLTKTYSISDGLASAAIYDIGQDSRGIMWFATLSGVTSYDGTTWKNYSEADGLPKRTYYHLKIDSRDHIWVFPGRLDQGFFYLSQGKWHHIAGPPGKEAKKIGITSTALLEYKGKLFIGIGTLGNGFFIYKDPGWMHVTVENGADGTAFNTVNGVDCFRDSFYLATGSGLYILSPFLSRPTQSLKKIELNTPAQEIYGIAIKKRKGPEIWLTGVRWVGYYRGDGFHLVFQGDFPGFQPHHYIRGMVTLPDRHGGIWIGSNATFLNIDRDSHIENVGIQNDLLGDGAYALFYDSEANLWIGSFRGISKIVSFRFANYKKKHGLYDDEVTAIVEIDKGQILLGHNGGFSFFTGEKIEAMVMPGINKDIIFNFRALDMDVDREGNAWAAVGWWGIAKITPARRITWYKHPKPPKTDMVYSSVRADDTGTIWAGIGRNLLKLENNRLIPIRTDLQMGTHIRRIFRIDNHTKTIEFGSEEGFFHLKLKENKLVKIFSPDEDRANNVYSAYTDWKNTTWVGTMAGLFIVKGTRLVKFSYGDFRVDNPVFFITPDHDRNLWFGLDNGVIRWSDETKTARHYTPRDGLVGHETNRAAGFVDSRGRLWIGTAEGLSCYRKEKDEEKKTPPLLELLYVEVSGVKHPLDRPISVDYSQDDLTFYFRGISFIDETALRYHMKLEGYDNDWIRNFKSIDNQIRYTNIPPGHYTFHIQTVNARGIKSKIVSSPVIFIKNPWWKTPVFYLLIISVFGALLFNMTKYISKRRHAAQLEAQVRERTRELEVSRKYFSNIFENAHDAIILLEPADEVVLDVNQRACELYGFDRSEFIGMSLEKISKDVGGGKGKIQQTLNKGTYLNFETVQYRKDGSEMFLEVNASVIPFKGEKAILSINRDITERKRAEEQIKNSLKEKEVLLKEIHHRVKNNLQIILSLLDLQVESLEDGNILRMYQDSKDRIRSMALIHENLYQSEDLAHIDMEGYIESLIGYLWSAYGTPSTPVSPQLRVEDISLGIDMAIPIGLILTELFSNALKYAFPSGRKGEIFIQLQPGDGNTISLVFRDNGVGFPPDVAPLSQQSLGLQLVNLLTQQLNGAVEIGGSAGVSFTFSFPRTSGPGKKE